MTPQEYFLVSRAHNERDFEKQKELLETIRIQTFHLADLKRGTTYARFIQNFPFSWDKKNDKAEEGKADMTPAKSTEIQKRWDIIRKKQSNTTLASEAEAKGG